MVAAFVEEFDVIFTTNNRAFDAENQPATGTGVAGLSRWSDIRHLRREARRFRSPGVHVDVVEVFVGHREGGRTGVGFAVFATVATSGEAGVKLKRVESGPERALVPVDEGCGCFGGAGVVGGAVGDHEGGEFFDGDGVLVPAVR